MTSDHRLVLLRHAKSDWSGGEPDHDRPLAARGRRQAPEAGRWLAHHLDRVDLAVVSTALRARSTWSLAAAELAVAPTVRYDETLYGASAGTLLRVVRGLDDGVPTAVLIGHNPGFEDLASSLAGTGVSMPTSALAVLAVTGPWSRTSRDSVTLEAAGRPPA